MSTRGNSTQVLAARNHRIIGSAVVAEASAGMTTRVAMNNNRAPPPNKAMEPPNPNGATCSKRSVFKNSTSLRPTPGVSRARKRERSGRSGKEAVSPSPPPLRTARASFPACRSSRLTCRVAGRSEDPKAPALDSAFRVESHGLSVPEAALPCGPCVPWPFFLLFLLDPWEVSTLSSWGSPPAWWPYPSYYWRAFACSHVLYPLGIGPLCSRLSQWPDGPWGFPCSASRRCRRRRVTLCPGGGLSCRGADSRPVHPLHVPFGQSLSAVLALLTSRGFRVCTMLPIASFLSPALRVRLPEVDTFRRASHPSVTRDA